MPSTSKKQAHLMAAVAHNPAFAKKVGIPQSVGKDFNSADKGKKFGTGGGVGQTQGGKGMVNRQETRAGSIFGQKKEVPNINLNKYIGKKEGGKIMKKHDDEAQDKALIKKMIAQSKKKEPKGMKKGGMAESMGPRTMSKDVESGSNKLTKFGQSAVQKRGMTKGTNLGDSGKTVGIQKMAKGGKVKRYSGEDGESEVETETAQGPKQSIGDDVRARAMAAVAKGNAEEAPAPKAVSKPVLKAAPKAETPAATPKATPVQQAKDVVSGKGASVPKSFSDAGGSSKASSSKADLSSLKFKAPDPLAGRDRTGKELNNWSMKSGGKVGPSRGDGIAQRGRTKGKYC